MIAAQMGDEEVDDKQGVTPSPLVPIISVTPHSPAGKPYPILEDNLQQLHYIHESVQQMRDLALQPFTYQESSRLSASCPSLNDAGSDPDLISSINSTPTQTLTVAAPTAPRSLYHKRGSGEWELYRRNAGAEGECEVARRRSWAALEDLSHGKDSCKPGRQRSGNDLCSISLSSMESDMDDPFCESTANLLGTDDAIARVRQPRTNPNSSTHSLNEADLQGDFKIVVSKREAENRLLNTRLNSPLQKSVSTPSIIAVRELANTEPNVVESSATTLPVHSGHQLHGTTGSEEDDVLDGVLVPAKGDTAFDYYAPAAYDDHPEKRRKRGSLFFRKKKEKTKKTPHQWVTVCYGNSQVCDLCSKSLTNKPSVYCENCTITAHQNSCKDNLAECRGKINKSNVKNGGLAKPTAKRGSSSNTSGSPSRRTTLCYSPWRRVATKLGVQYEPSRVRVPLSSNCQVNIDDDHHYHPTHHDNSSYSDEVPQPQYEFLDEALVTVNDLETDPFLGLQDEEPDSWTPTVTKEIVKKLKEKEIKRQEHLYEFILTEKHHCLTLRVMQKVFVDGLQRYLNLGATIDRMFPRLNDLADIHLGFLHKLRARQKDNPVIDNVGDILLEQFGGPASARLKSVYGEFCSNHRNAIDIYKYYMQSDTRFAEFVKHCQSNPLLKKKGIPECILFVTQRLTKYPLLIEPLIKTLKDNREEQEKLVKALSMIKEILVEVDAQVAEKEKEDRKLEIYNRVEAKSFTNHKGQKFKKSDILDEKRKLRFEGIAMLMQGRGKMQVVLVIVFSDVLCFLLENNHKYSFFTPENKAGVVSLQKLLVREKAGQESRGIYLISSNPAEPEMFELKVHKPKDKQIWIKAIRTAVQECPEEEDEYNSSILSSEERQKQFDIKQRHLKELVELLKQKDKEQALVLEEKIALQLKLLAAAGVETVPERPSYMELMSDTLDSTKVRQDVHLAVKRVNQIAKSLYASATNLSRSSSSVGEHQSDTFISPSLPKRAETFGGFDNQSPNTRALVQKKQPSPSSGESPLDSPDVHQQAPSNRLHTAINSSSLRSLFDDGDDCPTLLTEQDHQFAATQLAHHVYTLSCIISHQMTSIDSLEAEVAILKSHSGEITRPVYRHNQQLEELRNLQDKLQSEREVWARQKDVEMQELQQKKDEIMKLQEQIRHEQADVIHQREQLYRKLEALNNQGVIVNSPLLASSSPDDTGVPHAPATDPPKKRNDPTKWKPPPSVKAATLPLNLISTSNQQKVSSNVQIRQQLPLKLATKFGTAGSPASPSSSPQQLLPLKLREGAFDAKNVTSCQQKQNPGSPTQIPSHSRTGSSPAMMQNIQLESKSGAKAGRTNTYPKLPDKFKMKSPETGQDSVSTKNSNDDVIFF